MAQALYRKYRPTIFSEVVGQAHIKQVLLNELKNGQITHAYLFCGPRGIGKTTLARLLAKGVNCLSLKEGEPCQACKNCQTINQGRALDFIEIDAASHTGVDNVRENVISQARVAPAGLKYKVFIIDEAHMLSLSAFNALLKTLEEPPKQAIFILATTEIHKLPATIVSRCQRFDFKKISLPQVLEKLERIVKGEGRQVDLEVLKRIGQHCDGALRDAESLLGQVLTLEEEKITKEVAELVMPYSDWQLIVDFWQSLSLKQAGQALEQVNQLLEQGVDLQDFSLKLIEFLRKIILYKINGRLEELDYIDVSKETHQQIKDSLGRVSVKELQRIIEIFIQKNQALKSAPIAQLPLELAVIEICYPQEIKVEAMPVGPRPKPKIKLASSTPKAEVKEEEENKELFQIIEKKWDSFLKKVGTANHSLAMTLGVAHLVEVRGQTLVLGFKYKFHQDRLENITINGQLTNLLKDFFGQEIKLRIVVSDEFSNKVQGDNLAAVEEGEVENIWDLAMNTFGSE